MSDASVPAGWHPDPEDPSGSVRWWDGAQWTSNVHPRPQPFSTSTGGDYSSFDSAVSGSWQQPSDPWQSSNGGWSPSPAPVSRTWWHANPRSMTAIVVTCLYVALALSTGIRVLGILPVVAAVRAFSSRERLAPVAAVAAGVALLIGLNILHLHH